LITASARATVEKPSSSQRRACGGLSGRGDPQRALAGLYFWTWDTEEVLDLIRWMRKWNSDPKHSKVKFYGFDTRKMPRAAQVALAYITRVAKGESANWATQLAPLTNELDSQPSRRHGVRGTASADQGGQRARAAFRCCTRCVDFPQLG
jgi:erythromycin esterase-like protein